VPLGEKPIRDETASLVLNCRGQPRDPWGLKSQEDARGLQKRGFPVRIWTNYEIHARTKFRFVCIEASKMADLQRLEWHRAIELRRPKQN